MRTAVMLLTLLALASIPGSVLPQRNVASNPGAVVMYFRDHPALAPWLDKLGLFDAYGSPWFAATYIVLLISMTGCVLPRCWHLWKNVRSEPPPAPSNLARLEHHQSWHSPRAPEELLATAAADLRRRRYRVVITADQIRAERGYIRELGNLGFHLSLLVLLVGIAFGKLYGFEGRVAVAEGGAFTNLSAEYDEFNARPLTDTANLEPFNFRLDDFKVAYETRPPKIGEPRDFTASLTYQTGDNPTTRRTAVSPNHPLDINGTKVFLTGNGYAPVVTVRDGRGNVVFSGAVISLPQDSSYASKGVIKAPDAKPEQLGFEGLFLPTAAFGARRGPYSLFPDALNPRLVLTAYTGDLGLDSGVPQSVFALDKTRLTQVRQNGQPFAKALAVGQTMRLPGGQGSLTFDRVARFANFQIAYDPGTSISLVAAVMLLIGVTLSLTIRRRRIWVRTGEAPGREVPGGDLGPQVEIAGLSLTRRAMPAQEITTLAQALGAPEAFADDHPRNSLTPSRKDGS